MKKVRSGDWERMRKIKPRGYVCRRAPHPIAIDGALGDPAWKRAPWSEDFKDIEGDAKPAPPLRTQVKMLWDDTFFYVGARLEEPHVWATLARKNSIIFEDNDFEVFIDPDGDNHDYYEFEVNALNTIWELNLIKPYKDGGPAIHATNIEGLESAVRVAGTLNDPSDEDEGWTVEIAFPFAGLARYNGGKAPPEPGDLWRVNFSRVEWRAETVGGRYRKVPDRPEDNWVWSPQGVIDMHRPERWGFVRFAGKGGGKKPFEPDPAFPARELLMEVYYGEKVFFEENGRFAGDLEELGLERLASGKPARIVSLRAWDGGFKAEARITLSGGGEKTLTVDHDSRILAE